MSKRRKVADKLPVVTSDIPRDLRLYLDRVRDTLSDTGQNQIVTIGDLQRIGLVDNRQQPVTPSPSPIPDDFLPTPPVIAGLAGQGAFQNIVLSWAHVPYRGHMYVEVWGSPIYQVGDDTSEIDNLEVATLVGFAPGGVFVDNIGGGRGRFYWVRNVNLQGNTGAFNAVAGTQVETAQDVDFLITTLQGQIGEGVLAESLASRIDLIDITALTGYDAAISARSVADDARDFADSINFEFDQYRTDTGAWFNQYQQVNDSLVQTAESLMVRTDTTESQILNIQSVSEEQAQTLQLIGVRSDTAESSILNLQTVSAEQAQAITQLNNKTGDLESELLRVDEVSAGAASSTLLLTARAEDIESEILDVKSVTAEQAQSITGLVTRTAETEAAVVSINQTAADMASQLNQVQLTQGDQSAAIQQESQVRANETGQLFAQYTVKIDVNGYVAGFGLSSTPAEAGGQTSEFSVLADRFYIASPSLGAENAPFIVQATPTTINGVPVPAGIYMTDTFIRNGSIVNAKIANAAIDDAKIANLSAGKITTGTLDAERIATDFLSTKQFIGKAANNVEVRIGYSSGANEVFGIYAPDGTAMLAYNTNAMELQLNNSRLGDAAIKHIGAFSKEVWEQIAPTDGTGGTEVVRNTGLNTALNTTKEITVTLPEANPSPAYIAISVRDSHFTVGDPAPNAFTAPTYRIVVRRGSAAGTIVLDVSRTGTASSDPDDTIPVTYSRGFNFNEIFEVTDTQHSTPDGNALTYVVQVTRTNGSANNPIAPSVSLSVPLVGAGGARALGQLNDVDLTSPSNNQFLTYNGSIGRWVNSGPPSTVVPATRTVNGKALNSNITLTAADVGAAATTHSHTIADVTDLQTTLNNKVNTAAVGTANGVASLDSASKIPVAQIPIEARNVFEYANAQQFPAQGFANTLFVAIDTGAVYYWKNNQYTLIGAGVDFTNITNKPTTLAGYGITDAYTKLETYNRGEVDTLVIDGGNF